MILSSEMLPRAARARARALAAKIELFGVA